MAAPHLKLHTVKKDVSTTFIMCPNDCDYAIDENSFSPDFWQDLNLVVAVKKGRANTYFLEAQEDVWVLRHYWRGGLIGKILSDQYLYTGLKNTRTYREFTLLCKMQKMGLPVPSPVAAKVFKRGLIYTGDLITKAISEAKSVTDVLSERTLTKSECQSIGQTLAEFHNHGVYHADLNINNILFDGQGKVYVIDFDRGDIRTPNSVWQQQNMARLERSFNKEAGRHSPFYFDASTFSELNNAYQQALK